MSRITWIDNMKGFFIIEICLLHFHFPWLWVHVCAIMCVAIFYICSGLLFNPGKYLSFTNFVKAKAYSLLFPYFCFALVFLFLDPLLYNRHLGFWMGYTPFIENFSHSLSPEDSVVRYFCINLLKIFVEGTGGCNSGPLWFVFVLFGVSCVLYLSHIIFSKFNSYYDLLLFLAIFLFYGFGWYCHKYSIHLPFSIDIVSTCTSISMMGYLAKRIWRTLSLPFHFNLIVLLLCLFPLYMIAININGIELYNNNLGPYYWGAFFTIVIGGVLFSLLFILLSKLPKLPCYFIGNILRLIAQNAMIVIASHFGIGRLVELLLRDLFDSFYMPYVKLFAVIVFCCISVPFFNQYLPWIVGKSKK